MLGSGEGREGEWRKVLSWKCSIEKVGDSTWWAQASG